jgi:hypothetical protein
MTAVPLAFQHLRYDDAGPGWHWARFIAATSCLISVIVLAASLVRQRIPFDAFGFRLDDHIVGRLNVIPPRPVQPLGQGVAAAVSPALLRIAAPARRVSAREWLTRVLCSVDTCRRRQRKRHSKRDGEIERQGKPGCRTL